MPTPFEIDRGVRGETGVTLVPIVRGHEESSIADGGIVADARCNVARTAPAGTRSPLAATHRLQPGSRH